MVVYHTAFDLSARSLIPVDITRDPGWIVFARSIASTFLLLVGVGLVLATQQRPQNPALSPPSRADRRRRLPGQPGDLVGRAGCLHLLRHSAPDRAGQRARPALRAVAAELGGGAGGRRRDRAALPLFQPGLRLAAAVVGRACRPPPRQTVDYVPVFPWFGVVLAGIVVGRLFVADFSDSAFARWRPENWAGKAAAWAGRWSLRHLPGPPADPLWAFVGGKPAAVAERNGAPAQFHGSVQPGLPPAGARRHHLQHVLRLHVHQSRRHRPDDACGRWRTSLTDQRSRWDGILAACRPPDSTN